MVSFLSPPSFDGVQLATLADLSFFQTFSRAGELEVVEGQGRFTFPVDGVITGLSASVGTPGEGGVTDISLNQGGSVEAFCLIEAMEHSAQMVVVNHAVSAGDWMRIDIVSVSSTPPQDLTAVVRWRPA